MKRIFKMMPIIAMMGVILISCSKDETGIIQTDYNKEITIKATLAEPDCYSVGDTKTILQSDGSVWWNVADAISLFYGSGNNGGNKFTSTNTEPAQIANFTGNIGVITGGGEITYEHTFFWGVYPYSGDVSCNGTSVTLNHPAAQKSSAGTFSNGQFPTLGRSRDLLMSFYNICGGIKFTVTRSDIVKVIFEAKGGESLAGTLNVGFDENSKPKVNSITNGSSKITVIPQAGGTFVAGATYFAVIPPVTMAQGIDVTYRTETQEATYTNSNSITINRSMFKTLTGKDAGLEFQDIPFPLATDLSIDGSANCYIVSKKGMYKFKTVKGNSDIIVGDIKGVKVLWETFGTDVAPTVGDLIKADISYSGNYLCFNTNDTYAKGNAVIAAYSDANCTEGNVLWSWHIWLTDQPAEHVYNNSAGTMMDRNLGATSATPGDVCALGLLYQWGRKDPFLGSSSISSSIKAESTISWPSYVVSNADKGTIIYAVSHPTTFICCGPFGINGDWYYTGSKSTDNTRWQTLDKTKGMYDPCPTGWRVPEGGDCGVWFNALGSKYYNDAPWDNTNKGSNFGSGNGRDVRYQLGSSTTIWYPSAGHDHQVDHSFCDTGSGGYYWSCTPRDEDARDFTIYSGLVITWEAYNRAKGLSVRCLKESK